MAEINKELLYEKLGLAIKEARRSSSVENSSKKLSQQWLGKKLGLTRTSVTNIEAGNQHPPLHLIYEICITLNIDLYDILPSPQEAQLNSFTTVKLGDKELLAPTKTASYIESFSNKGDHNE